MIFVMIFLATMATADTRLKVKDAFPDFSIKGLGAEKSMALKDFKGKVVFVDFWASWCVPCKQELPVLNKLYKKYQNKAFEVIGINVDEDEDVARQFIKENKLQIKMGFDKGKLLASKCNLDAMPSSFILDRKAFIKFIHLGFAAGEKEGDKLDKEVASLLAEDK